MVINVQSTRKIRKIVGNVRFYFQMKLMLKSSTESIYHKNITNKKFSLAKVQYMYTEMNCQPMHVLNEQ